MRRQMFAAAAIALALGGVLAAQSTTQDRPTGMDQLKAEKTQMVTVEGCLVNEKDVPGREPNLAERAAKPTGMLQDFILTEAKFLKGAPEGYVGTTGAEAGTAEKSAGPMFEVRGIEASRLNDLVGKRVEIEGRIDPNDLMERSRTQAQEGKVSANDLPEIHGTTIKQIAGECKPPVK